MYYSNYNDFNNLDEQDAIETTGFVAEPEQEPKPKKKRVWHKVTALVLACAIVGGGAGIGGAALWGGVTKGSTTIYQGDGAPTVVTIANVQNRQKLTPQQIYATYVGSTVGITTEITTNVFGQQVQNAASGSGFVISRDGYIITNYHVIDGASSIKVTFVDGKSYDATLRGGDEENDIAVLKIDATDLTPVVVGSSDDLVVGDTVFAIGNPLGELTYSLTDGLVSALDRNVTMSDGRRMNYIQTNTAINSGNSGGALFNEYGEVVGIVSAKLSSGTSATSASVEGLGFAIPLDNVKSMLTDIIEHGYITGKPYMGIVQQNVSGEAIRYGTPAGAYVLGVVENACSAKAGLQKGDIITGIGDTEVTSSDTLQNAMKEYKAGDSTSLTINRSGEKMTLNITFDERTVDREAASQSLVEQIEKEQQELYQQQQQQQQGNVFSWPFGW